MIRLARLLPFAALAVLAACSDRGESNLVKIGRVIADQTFPEDPAVRAEPSRAELDAIPSALLALTVSGQRAYVVPLTDNQGYLTYLDANRRGLVMHDGAITGTLGIGYDLQALKTQSDDPVFNQTPVSRWPGQVNRVYQYLERDQGEFIVSLTCTFERVARERIEIVERSYDVIRIAETCTNQARQITNLYWVEEDTGFVWKSQQWVSPQLPVFEIEIIRPYQAS
ncbi:MAG: YjbF family lipoprotein [Pseudomonadota bacterium]